MDVVPNNKNIRFKKKRGSVKGLNNNKVTCVIDCCRMHLLQGSF